MLLYLLLAAAPSAGLALEISTPRQAVLVGEPVKLVVTWKASRDLPRVAFENGGFQSSPLTFIVSDATSAHRYTEVPHETGDEVVAPGALRRGQERISNLVLAQGRYVGESG
jgi:hypothetical protein